MGVVKMPPIKLTGTTCYKTTSKMKFSDLVKREEQLLLNTFEQICTIT